MKHLSAYFSALCLLILLSACGETSTQTAEKPQTEPPVADQPQGDAEFALGSGPEYAYQKTEEFLEYWEAPKAGPVIDYRQDLTKLNLSAIRLLRQTVQARKGYLFSDDQVRQHFMGLDWYQPVWYDEKYTPVYNKEEQEFMQRARELEVRLQADQLDKKEGAVHTDRIVNRYNFEKEVLAAIDPVLGQHGLAIHPAKREQMFHLYDENNYRAIPSFVTSDFYLQLLNIYFSRLLQELETDKFSPVVQALCEALYAENATDIANIDDATWKQAAEYNQMFYGMAYELLTGQRKAIPARLLPDYEAELSKIERASGQGSKLLQSEFFDFSLFKPRGHYTRTPELTRYFKAMMWLQTPPFYAENQEAFHAAMVTATHFLEKPAIRKHYQTLSDPVQFLVGDPNRNSLNHLYQVMEKAGMPADPLAFFSQEYKAEVIRGVEALGIRGFENKGANDSTDQELQKFAVYFLPQRYTFDAEILIRLVNIARIDLNEPPKRPFPKGLDIFAALGNSTAEDILLRQYKENETWPAYKDSLKAVQQKFANYDKWDKNGYNRWMNMLRDLLVHDPGQPFFMQTRGWRLKSLNTALASWAELKHNTLLYAEQPMAAQMGSGGEDWPPAYVHGYVEPNLRFWKRALALVRAIEQNLTGFDLLTSNIKGKSDALLEMGERLQAIAQKEVNGQALSSEDKDYIRFIGGDAEYLTLRLLDKSNLSWYEVNAQDKFMAVVADVYTYQGRKPEVLEEGVGYADEMYVTVKMPNGDLQLMRGAVFSYYEFKQPINERLTDPEWQKMLQEDRAPARPVWMQEVLTGK